MNNSNKGFSIVLIIFAIIGLISVIGLGVFALMKISDKFADRENQAVTTIELEDNRAQESEDTAPNIELEAESGLGNNEPPSTTEVTEVLQDALIPDVRASVEDDDVELNNDRLQIVFMGDSILDNFRDGTGIVYLVGQALDADVINLAIGGTCASCSVDNDKTDENWDATCGAGVAKAVCGIISPEVFYDCTAKTLIKEHMDDFKNTDIFVIEYGINDFMFGRQMVADDGWDPTTYVGGLRHMMDALTQTYPNAKVVMCQPSYVEFFRENGEYVGNTYVLDNGTGTEYDYGRKMENIANEFNAYFFPFDDNGITMTNASETLLDGIHLSETGRKIYAENLAEFIKDKVIDPNR